MNLDDVLNFIAGLQDDKECKQVESAAYKRKRELAAAAWQVRVDAHWKKVGYWKPGQTVYCGATGRCFGGPLQRGDAATIHSIQPRKRTLWLTIKGKTYGFPASQVCRYNLQAEPPDNPLSATERKVLDSAADVFARL